MKRCILWLMLLLLPLAVEIAPVLAIDTSQEVPLPDEARKAYEQSLKEMQEKSQASKEWIGKIKTNFTFETKFLHVNYNESSTRLDLTGDYNTNAVRGDLGLEAYFQKQDGDSYGLEVSYGMMLPASGKETWTLDDLDQKNDVELKSNEFKIGVGWKHWFNPKLGLGQSLFYGHRQFKQTGNNSGPVTDSLVASSGDFTSTAQTTLVDYVAYKPRLIWKPLDKIEAQVGILGGYIFFAKVSSPAIDASDISNHSIYGSLMGVEGKVTYFILDEFSIYVGGAWDRQRLDGYYKAERQGTGVKHSEIRESNLDTKGFIVGVDFRF